MPPPRLPLFVVAGLLVAGLGVGPSRGALAGAEPDRLAPLVAAYESSLGRHDDAAYAADRTTLDAIADLDTPAARRALRGFAIAQRDTAAPCDGRRTALVLAALVRRGTGPDLEFAVGVVESGRCPGLESALPRILGGAVGASARTHLREVLLRKGRSAVRAAAARALGAIADREAVLPLLGVLREDDLLVRAEALAALGELKDPGALAGMTVFLAGPDVRLREVAARALGMLGSRDAVPALVRALDDASARVAESAAGALALLSPEGVAVSVPAILARWAKARGADERLEEALERALARITGVDIGPDPDLWASWWAANKDRPPAEISRKDAPTTVAGPRYYGFAVRSNRVAFVIDVSRSMDWNGRLDGARKELVRALAGLSARTKFTVIPFSDAADPWSERLVPANPDAVRRATRLVERLEPLGGTNSFAALRAAFADEEVDTIWFLSDGFPSMGSLTDPDEILGAVRELNRWRRVRIHTVAPLLGEPPPAFADLEEPARAERFMRRLAEENDGHVVVLR